MYHWPIEIISMKKNIRMPRADLDRLRLKLLRSQLIDAYKNIPFYRKAFKLRGLVPHNFKCIKEIRDYPVITRTDIQEEDSNFLSKKFKPGKVKQSHSSGSTGRPLWVSFDPATWIRKKYLSKLRSRIECGMKMNERVAIYDTESTEALTLRNQCKLLSNPLFKAKYFSIFRDTKNGIEELLQWAPQNIDSLPSHLFQLAIAMEQSQLKPNSLKRIFTSSEYIESNMRRYIQDRYAAEVFDIYGCTEIKEIAWECDRHNGYHINEDEVFLEILDGDKPAGWDEVGDIVITDLRNKAMPLIRYRIGDRGLLRPGLCSCGRTFALMVPSAGRSSDFIITPDGHKLSPYRFTTAIEKINGLLQYQFIQKDVRSIIVKAIMSGKAGPQELREIKTRIQAVVAEPMDIKVETCKKIDMEQNGKFKVVKNIVKNL